MGLFGGDESRARTFSEAARAGLIALAVMLLGASAPAGNPAKHGTKAEEYGDQAAKTNQSAAAPATLVRKRIGADANNIHPPKVPAEHDEEGTPKWTDIAMAVSAMGSFVLTVVLAGSTVFLWRETKRLAGGAEAQHETLKESVAAAQGAANAALEANRLSRDSFVADHRPRLILRDVYFNSANNFENITYEISNIGDLTAAVTAGFIALEFVGDARGFKDWTGRSLGVLAKNGFKPGALRSFGFDVPGDVRRALNVLRASTHDVVKYKADKRYSGTTVPAGSLFFFGVVRYADIADGKLGTERLAVFRRQWHPAEEWFLRTGDVDHEHSD